MISNTLKININKEKVLVNFVDSILMCFDVSKKQVSFEISWHNCNVKAWHIDGNGKETKRKRVFKTC